MMENNQDLDIKLLEKALQDPASKNLIVNLLTANNKNVFEFFNAKTPVKKIAKKTKCESPTALLRRRELKKLTKTRPESPQSGTSVSSSKSSRSSTVPFENILRNVVAYVEINSNGNDRSAGAKALLKSMGATVREQFLKDVTHVIFKDGSYGTYHRAKLLKVHFVSVLWLEASRRNNVRELEKNYPALGTKNYDHNVSLICSQMQKDYEGVIRSEIRRTLESGISLPSTKFLIESTSSNIEDDGVEDIISKIRGGSQCEGSRNLELGNVSPLLTSDASMSSEASSKILGMSTGKKRISEVDDSFVPLESNDGLASKMEMTCLSDSDSDECRSLISRRRISRKNSTNMELTNVLETPQKKTKKHKNDSSDDELYKIRTPKIPIGIFTKPSTPSLRKNTRKTIDTSNIDESTTDLSSSSQNKSAKKNRSTMSSLRFSFDEHDKENSCIDASKVSKSSSNMSSLRLSSEKILKNSMETSNSNMSSLRLSLERGNSRKNSKNSTENTTKSSVSNMSSLRLSSDSVNCKKTAENSIENSKSTSDVEKSKDEIKLRRKSTRLTSKNENSAVIDLTKIKDVIVHENIKIIPKTSKIPEKVATRKSRRQTISQKKPEIEKRNENSQHKLSRSKSESQIDTRSLTTRKRRLFDPNDVAETDIIQDDDEERENIRKEKALKIVQKSPKIIQKSPGTYQIGNVLLTKKAVELLEKNGNSDKFKKMFSTPKITRKTSIINRSTDRQSELIEEFVNKKTTQNKKDNPSTPVTKRSQKALTDFCRKRRSTLDFQNSERIPRIRAKIQYAQKPTIVCTKLHKADVQIFQQVVKKLGGFDVENEVSSRTTHLVVGEPLRTINMLRALARGLWIVKQEWLFTSLEQNKWVPEEKFEAVEFSSAVQRCRLERTVLGSTYTMNIFQGLGKIYIAPSTTPRSSDLRELVVLCEGKTTKNENLAKIAVGIYVEGCQCVNEYWILDSIRCGKKKALNKYAISNQRKSIQV